MELLTNILTVSTGLAVIFGLLLLVSPDLMRHQAARIERIAAWLVGAMRWHADSWQAAVAAYHRRSTPQLTITRGQDGLLLVEPCGKIALASGERATF